MKIIIRDIHNLIGKTILYHVVFDVTYFIAFLSLN